MDRIVNFLTILFPLFSAVAIVNLTKKKIFQIVVFSIIILSATAQFYECQLLIPSAQAVSKNLPADEPLVYVVNVNTVYQRLMIAFSEKYALGRLASDRVTQDQIRGLTDYNFSSKLTWYYPISSLVDNRIKPKDYDYFLIHLPGKSGAFYEQVEMRITRLIVDVISNHSIVYSNGESYVLVPHRSNG